MKRLPTDLSTRHKSLPDREISCVRVALDIPLATLFDYAIPKGLAPRPGDRVVVPFGSRERIGLVIEAATGSALPAERMKSLSAPPHPAPPFPAHCPAQT